MWSGVRRLLASGELTLVVDFVMRSFTIAAWPFWAAMYSGVAASCQVPRLGLVPAFASRCPTQGAWPFAQAIKSAVDPSLKQHMLKKMARPLFMTL